MKEPSLLPTTFPNILVSANQGIAVGMASQLCGFNLGEVRDTAIAYLKHPDCKSGGYAMGPIAGGEWTVTMRRWKPLPHWPRQHKGGRNTRYDKANNLIGLRIPYTTTTEAILE